MKRPVKQSGFTLLEVMVALAIIGIAMAAAITTVSTSVYNAAGLQERTFAHWVAMNKMTELQIKKEFPAFRTTTGSTILAEHEWYWTQEVIKGDPAVDKLIREVQIQVRTNEEDEFPLITLIGFVGKP